MLLKWLVQCQTICSCLACARRHLDSETMGLVLDRIVSIYDTATAPREPLD